MVSEKGPALKLTAEETERRDALRIEREAAYKEMSKFAEDGGLPRALLERVRDLQEKLYPLEEHEITHGFVWLYRRIPPARPHRRLARGQGPATALEPMERRFPGGFSTLGPARKPWPKVLG
jgi:hypothetical protein